MHITMTKKHKQRLALVVFIVIGASTAVALALTAFNQNMMFFYDPSQIAAGEAPVERNIRVGGMVKTGSVQRDPESLAVQFDLTDYAHTITVEYTGILPDLFREGQGIVAIGQLQEGQFIAAEVLAKHDENYMPQEVASSLKSVQRPPLTEEGVVSSPAQLN